MAENNPGDILTCDWNPFVGCERYSPGCAHCWFLEGIYPWQQRLGNIPQGQRPEEPFFYDQRMTSAALAGKNGIIGICQHGDLFWDKVSDAQIHATLNIVDAVAPKKIAQRIKAGRPAPKYMLWTKRVDRMRRIMSARYGKAGGSHRVPDWYGLGASLENQKLIDRRLPDLLAINGFRIAVLEPILGQVDLKPYIDRLDWVVISSETGEGCRLANADWFRRLRDVTKAADKPFFIKQIGTSHKSPMRDLDGRTWDEFPPGFVKRVKGVRDVQQPVGKSKRCVRGDG